ncbi:EAL domain-containing protein [Halomonas pacifica]|uniref:bifunctional diguanylate cyclase/phosphodiesterase n=1 Tax=Bisbaumannia pacifica TaxID=77098 RepID=UPI002358693E|nr:EAL domain-containing protein [Halomonas pacifica]MDC8804343.1 EAL domain-containing protein [Halomonas pacifica]
MAESLDPPLHLIDRAYRSIRRQLVLLVLAALTLSLLVLLWSAQTQNAQQAERELTRLETQLEQLGRQLGGQVLDYALWDASHEQVHLRPALNPHWLAQELGSSLRDNLAIDLAMLIAPDGGVDYAMQAGAPWQAITQPPHPLPPRASRGARIAYARWQDQPMLLAIAEIRPESPHLAPAARPHRLLFARRLEGDLLEELRKTAGLPDLALTQTPSLGQRLAMHDAHGRELAWLHWSPQRPGRAILLAALPWLAGVMGGFALLTAGLFRRLTRQLEQSRTIGEELQATQAGLAAQQQAWQALRALYRRGSNEEEFLAAVLAHAERLLGDACISIWRLDPESQRLICRASLEPAQRGESLDLAPLGAYRQALLQGPYLAVSRVEADPRLREMHGYFRQHGIVSLLDIGIFDGGELRGILCCESSRPRHWRSEEISSLTALSGLLSQFSESLHRRVAEQHLKRRLEFDDTTGLPTLRKLMAHLARQEGDFTLGVLRITGLHRLNETLGFAAGDRALRELVLFLRHWGERRQLEAHLARLPSNRLALVARGLDRAQVESLGAELLSALNAQRWLAPETPYHLRFFLGLARYPEDDRQLDRLLLKAELAVKQAREHPHHPLALFDPRFGRWMQRQDQLTQQLRQALPREELRLLLQPQFDAAGVLRGAEVLLRWEHPDQGLLAPGDFVPVAERSGLIRPIGSWLLEQSLALLAGPLRDSHLNLSVNVSVQQLHDDTLVEQLEALLRRYPVGAGRLVLEVVESLLLAPGMETRLARLRDLGVEIALDDFGTGYSSLRYLQELSVDEIKLDKAFIDPLHQADDAPLARSIIALVRTLGLRLVVEGVESAHQLDFLRRQGVDLLQGYYLARPESPEAFLARLDAQAATPEADA